MNGIKKYEAAGIEFCLERKKVKNINLRVRCDGTVCISANTNVPIENITAFVVSRAKLIENARRRIENLQFTAPPAEFAPGEMLPYLGRLYPIAVFFSSKEFANLREGIFEIHTKAPDDPARRKKLADAWYDKQCRREFERACRRAFSLVEEYGLLYPQIRVRRMRSLWGSCQWQNGVITLNRALIEKPYSCIEYVALHEFVHFIHPNHSGRFHVLMAAFMPDYRQRKSLLNGIYQVKE